MKGSIALISSMVATIYLSAAYAQGDVDNPLSKLAWQLGPSQGAIGEIATITIPESYLFLSAGDTTKFMEMAENISSGNEYLFAPDDLRWFAVFEFESAGYVRDDEAIEPAPLLESVQRGTEIANQERVRRGWSTLDVLGWRFEPRYDKQQQLLEWAFRAKDSASSDEIVNYNTRLLGRTGVMAVTLVADPATLDASVSELKAALPGYNFAPGQTYAEYRQGDRVAEFGLAALVAGGAAAIATKKGLWAVLGGALAAGWKIMVAVAVAAIASIGRLFKRR